MGINLLKRINRRKGELAFPLLLLASTAICFGQILPLTTPSRVALSSSTVARFDDPRYGRDNPAALASVTTGILSASFTPWDIGIKGFYEAGLLAASPIDSTLSAALWLEASGKLPYVGMIGAASAAWKADATLTVGTTVSLYALSIERYGSASAWMLDLGMIVHPAPGIRFGAAIRNSTGARIADVELPQTIAAGFAFDPQPGTTISVDMTHELRRTVSTSLGLSMLLLPGLSIRAGIGHEPTSLSLGAAYDFDGVMFDYGGAYISPLGIRHAVGAGIRW